MGRKGADVAQAAALPLILSTVWVANKVEPGCPCLNVWFLNHFARTMNPPSRVATTAFAVSSAVAVGMMFVLAVAFRVAMDNPLCWLPLAALPFAFASIELWRRRTVRNDPSWCRDLDAQAVEAIRHSPILVASGRISAEEVRGRSNVLERAAQHARYAESLLAKPEWQTPALADVGIRAAEAIDRSMLRAIILAHETDHSVAEIQAIADEMHATVRDIEKACGTATPIEDGLRESLQSVRSELQQIGVARRELASSDGEVENRIE